MTVSQCLERQTILTLAHHEYQKGLSSHAFFKVGDRTLGEDLVQDTFMKTWSYLVRGGEINVMRAFLYHVLNNLIIDQYRKPKTTSLDDLMEKGFDPMSPSPDFVDGMDGGKAITLISHLPAKYKKVMQMRYKGDLSLEEISLATKQTKNAIAVQLHRGTSKLKELYGNTK